jgi:hypothetical protein
MYTSSRVRAAGKRIVAGSPTPEDIEVLENFRAAHAYVLNTFQMNARRHSAGTERTLGQRLKRRATIVDKLRREPSMPLSAMHDIAGCRLIFADQEALKKVRSSLRAARFKHKRLNDENKYDYISNPKATGYRGVHDIFEYNVQRGPGVSWNGLKVEIQFRTQPQHAWATAVEVADLILSSRIKFAQAEADQTEYFCLASEIIARTAEDQRSCRASMSNGELRDSFLALDEKMRLLHNLDNLRRTAALRSRFRKNTLLIFKLTSDGSDGLEIRTFENFSSAIDEYNALERKYGSSADIVLVRGETEESIRDAFRNYFSDAQAFVDLIRSGLVALG